jgi:hypothetical protein
VDAYGAEWVGAENVLAGTYYPWQRLLADTRHKFRYKNHRSSRRLHLGCLEGAESARYQVSTDKQHLVEVNTDMQYPVKVDSEVEVKLSPERQQNRGANID